VRRESRNPASFVIIVDLTLGWTSELAATKSVSHR
jgi:hypothetical protein